MPTFSSGIAGPGGLSGSITGKTHINSANVTVGGTTVFESIANPIPEPRFAALTISGTGGSAVGAVNIGRTGNTDTGTTCSGPGQILSKEWKQTYTITDGSTSPNINTETYSLSTYIDVLIDEDFTGVDPCSFFQAAGIFTFPSISTSITGNSAGNISYGGVQLTNPIIGGMSFTYNISQGSSVTITYDDGFDEGQCSFLDPEWVNDCIILSSLGGRYYKMSGHILVNKSVIVCSNDSMVPGTFANPSHAVLLRTRYGRYFLTTCARINFGKKEKKKCDDDPFCHFLKVIWCGDPEKPPRNSKLDKVSTGIVMDYAGNNDSVHKVKSQIGAIIIENAWGSTLYPGTEVVIFNADKKNNFIRMLGPTT